MTANLKVCFEFVSFKGFLNQDSVSLVNTIGQSISLEEADPQLVKELEEIYSKNILKFVAVKQTFLFFENIGNVTVGKI